MPIVVALILAALFQLVAAFIAVSLIRHTRYNISWVLISVAFILMAARRIMALVEVLQNESSSLENPIRTWMAVAISVLILAGLFFIKRIFNAQKRIDELKIENDARVLSAILETEESERQKFAKELHDGLGPLLSSIKMSVSALDPGKATPGQMKILENTNKLIDESVNTIKEISNKLSPHVLDHFGLLRAINSFIDTIGVNDALSPKISSNTEGLRFDTQIEVVLYRVVCELINNTINHAGATEFNIDLFYHKGSLSLDYYDNGQGFDPEEVLSLEHGMGYSNIQSRLKSIHGTMQVISQPGKGVCVSIVIKTSAHG